MPGQLIVGDVHVDPATNSVIRDGQTIHLEPKSMEVLLQLAAAAGEVVTREALLDAVWPGVIVGEDSLTNAIIKIRRAFGDDARAPRFVETIPKRGYRLIARVARPASPQLPGRAPGQPDAAGKRSTAVAPRVAILLAALVAGVAAWWSWPQGASLVPHEKAEATATDTPTLAVATFDNLSGDPAQDYLSRGISDTMLSDLASIPGFAVMRAGTAAPAAARYRLEGNVQRSAERIRVEAQLVDSESGRILYALRIERPFTDLLTIEDEIRSNVLRELAVKLNEVELAREARGYTRSVAAYDLFLQGQQRMIVRDRDGNAKARALYQQAIKLDPNFARAYGGLALTWAADYRNRWASDGPAALANALKYAQTAISIDDELPEQYWVIAYVRTQQRRFSEARDALNRALSLNPNYADAHALLGGIATYEGNPAASVPHLRKAIKLNPDAGYLYFVLLGRAYYFLGDEDQATINIEEALTRNPANIEAHLYRTALLARAGKMDDAEWELEEVRSLAPNFSFDAWRATYPMAAENQLAELRADLGAAGL